VRTNLVTIASFEEEFLAGGAHFWKGILGLGKRARISGRDILLLAIAALTFQAVIFGVVWWQALLIGVVLYPLPTIISWLQSVQRKRKSLMQRLVEESDYRKRLDLKRIEEGEESLEKPSLQPQIETPKPKQKRSAVRQKLDRK
jgi:prepilin signal peptidase PulO-like enzyme (type II secretory pathway)